MMRVGLIGYPVKHSISPRFQQAAFDALQLDVRYELWETPPDRLVDAVSRLREPGYLGANVTIPHKQPVRSLIDRVDATASAIGAVNTIVRDPDGSLSGFNTDVEGFARSIRVDGQTDLRGRKVVLLGSGGAARGVMAALLENGADEVVVVSRRPERAQDLLDHLRQGGLGSPRTRTRVSVLGDLVTLELAVCSCDVLVNATPVGMAGHGTDEELLVDPLWISNRMLVCDLIYNPPITPLLMAAQKRGARILNGLPMLVYQGAASFERWTGKPAPVALMRQKATEALHG
jgi:shikimate dehydrogenase